MIGGPDPIHLPSPGSYLLVIALGNGWCIDGQHRISITLCNPVTGHTWLCTLDLCPEVKGPDGKNSAGGLQVSSARKPTMPEPGILIATCMSINREQLFNVMGIVRKVFDVFPESGLAKRPRNFFFVPESGLRLLAGKPAAGPA